MVHCDVSAGPALPTKMSSIWLQTDCRARPSFFSFSGKDVSGSNRSSLPLLFLILILVIIRRGLICKTAGMQLRTGRHRELRFVLKNLIHRRDASRPAAFSLSAIFIILRTSLLNDLLMPMPSQITSQLRCFNVSAYFINCKFISAVLAPGAASAMAFCIAE